MDQIENLDYLKKAAVASIGKIRHNFPVPRMIEWACKTFMPIQTLYKQSVLCATGCFFAFLGKWVIHVLWTALSKQGTLLRGIVDWSGVA